MSFIATIVDWDTNGQMNEMTVCNNFISELEFDELCKEIYFYLDFFAAMLNF